MSEALYACLNITGLYHDVIIRRKKLKEAGSLSSGWGSSSRTSPINRYSLAFLKKDGAYSTLAYVLAVIQFTEVFAELLWQKKYGKESKLKFVFGVEVIKCVLRLVLFKRTGNRMLLMSCLPERESGSPGDSWRGVRAGHMDSPGTEALPFDLDSVGSKDIAAYLEQKALVSTKRSPEDLLNPLSGETLFSEYLFFIRPVVYSLLLLRSADKDRWMPWLLSLSIDIIGRLSGKSFFSKTFLQVQNAHIPTPLELDERRRRQWLLLFYLLRSPFYEKFTKNRIKEFCYTFGKIPILSIFANIVKEYVPLWEQVYFYTSAS